jgi:hypothetical protein
LPRKKGNFQWKKKVVGTFKMTGKNLSRSFDTCHFHSLNERKILKNESALYFLELYSFLFLLSCVYLGEEKSAFSHDRTTNKRFCKGALPQICFQNSFLQVFTWVFFF